MDNEQWSFRYIALGMIVGCSVAISLNLHDIADAIRDRPESEPTPAIWVDPNTGKCQMSFDSTWEMC